MGKRLELLSFQLPRAPRTVGRWGKTASALTQSEPVIDSRTADVKGAMRLGLAHAFFNGLQHAFAQICAITLAHTHSVAHPALCTIFGLRV